MSTYLSDVRGITLVSTLVGAVVLAALAGVRAPAAAGEIEESELGERDTYAEPAPPRGPGAAVEDGMGTAGDATRESLDRAGDATRRGLAEGAAPVGRGIDGAMDATGNALERGMDATGRGVRRAIEWMGGLFSTAGETMEGTARERDE